MTLKEQLDDLREKARGRIPAEARAIMEQAVDDLRRGALADHAFKVGDKVPDFTLPTDDGRMVSFKDELTRGPVVLSFFRGRW
jgi:hypothetical protein